MFEATSDQQSQQSVIVVSNNSVVVGGGGVSSTTVVNSSSTTNDVTNSNSVVVDGAFNALNEALVDAIHNDGCQRLNILSSYYYCTFQPLNHLHHLNLNFNLNNNKHLNTSTSSSYTSSPSSSSSTAQTNDSFKLKTNALTKDNLFDKIEQTGIFHDLKQQQSKEDESINSESLQHQVLNDSYSNAQCVNSEREQILNKSISSLLNDDLNKSKISVRSIHKTKIKNKKRLFLMNKQRSSSSEKKKSPHLSKLKESKSNKFRTIFKQSNSYLNRLKNYVFNNKNDRFKNKKPLSKYNLLTSKSTETTTVPLTNQTHQLPVHKRPLLKQIKTNSYTTSIQMTSSSSSDTNSKKRRNFFNKIIKFNRKKKTKFDTPIVEQPAEQSIINETSHNLELTQQMSQNYQTQQFCYDIEMMPPPNNQTQQTTTITNQQYFFDQVNNRSSILMSTNSLGIQNQLKQDLLKISFEKFKQFRLNEKLLQQTVLIRNAIKMLQYDIQYQQEQEQLIQQQHQQQQQMQQQIMDYSLNDQKTSTYQQTSNITMSTYENLDEFLSRSEFINNNILNVNNSIHNKNITNQTQINGIGCYFVNMEAQENNNTEYEQSKVLLNDQEPMQIKQYTTETIEDIDVGNDDQDDDLEEDDDEDENENDQLEEQTVDDKKFSFNLTDCNNKLDDNNTHSTFHSSNDLNNKFTLFIDNKLETNDTNNNSILTDDAKENFYLNTSDENDDYTIQNDLTNNLTATTMNASIFNTDFIKLQQQQQQS